MTRESRRSSESPSDSADDVYEGRSTDASWGPVSRRTLLNMSGGAGLSSLAGCPLQDDESEGSDAGAPATPDENDVRRILTDTDELYLGYFSVRPRRLNGEHRDTTAS